MRDTILKSHKVSPDVTKHSLHHLLTWKTFIVAHFGQGRVDTLTHFVSELCLSWQNEACCSTSAFCCVYTLHCMPPTGAHAQAHKTTSAYVFSYMQTRKILCVGLNIEQRDWCVCVVWFVCIQVKQKVYNISSWVSKFCCNLPQSLYGNTKFKVLLIVFPQSQCLPSPDGKQCPHHLPDLKPQSDSRLKISHNKTNWLLI